MIAKNSTANLGKSSLMLIKKSCLNFRLASNVNQFGESYTRNIGYINKKRAVVPLKKTYLDELTHDMAKKLHRSANKEVLAKQRSSLRAYLSSA
jgi:hypothetical protein